MAINIHGISPDSSNKARNILLKRFSPFDGIGHDLRSATSYEEAMRIARLDYTVEKQKLYLEGGVEIKDRYANIVQKTPLMLADEASRKDKNDDGFLGIVGKDYCILDNLDCFKVAEEIVNEGAGQYEVGGPSVGAKQALDYAKSFLVVRHEDFTIFDDTFNSYTAFNNSFDGSSGFQAYFANLRLICLNGLVRYFAGQNKKVMPKFYIQHSTNAKDRLAIVSDMLKKQRLYLEQVKQEAEALQATGFTKEQYTTEIIPLVLKQMKLVKPVKEGEEEGEERKRGKARIDETILRLVSAYEADDIQNYNNTAYKVLLAMSDFESHAEPLRNTNNPSIYFNRMLQGEILNTVVDYVVKSRMIRV